MVEVKALVKDKVRVQFRCQGQSRGHVIKRATNLAEDVGVGVVLQQHSGGPSVVVAGSDVQRRQADLSLGAIVDEQRHHILVALLQCHRQGGEPILEEGKSEIEHLPLTSRGASPGGSHLGGEALIGSILQQELDHLQMVLLGRHVERTKAFLWSRQTHKHTRQ